LTWSLDWALLADIIIRLVHFVDSGHLGWRMELVIGYAIGQSDFGINAKLSRAYDINISDGLSPFGRYGVMEAHPIGYWGETEPPLPTWWKPPFEIKESNI
jgi:hypothetical protein